MASRGVAAKPSSRRVSTPPDDIANTRPPVRHTQLSSLVENTPFLHNSDRNPVFSRRIEGMMVSRCVLWASSVPRTALALSSRSKSAFAAVVDLSPREGLSCPTHCVLPKDVAKNCVCKMDFTTSCAANPNPLRACVESHSSAFILLICISSNPMCGALHPVMTCQSPQQRIEDSQIDRLTTKFQFRSYCDECIAHARTPQQTLLRAPVACRGFVSQWKKRKLVVIVPVGVVEERGSVNAGRR
jgi:hypothetical protein